MNSLLLAAAVLAGFDWVGVSIATGKSSEEMSQRYFHSEEACRNSTSLVGDADDRVCFPVPSLPAEIWARQDASDRKELQGYFDDCIRRANSSWTVNWQKEALAACERYRPRD